MLPLIKEYKDVCDSENKLLIVSEGFEARALEWLKSLKDTVTF